MSYILDALRRADAQRERGRVPGLHTQALPMPASAAARRGRVGGVARRLGIAAVLLALVSIAGLAWWWWGPDAAPEPLAQPTAPPRVAPAAPPSAAAPPAATAAAPSPPPSTTAPMPAAGPIARAPVQPILAPAPPPPPPAATPAAPAKAAPAPATPASAAAPGAADDALPRVADLPAAARTGLPPLQVSGATYASNPALRMLIVDGKVLQEGQDIAPGLRLETIGPRAAVLNHQGQRLRLGY